MPNTAPFSYPVQITSSENGVIAVRVFFQDLDLSDTHSLVLKTDEMIGTGTVVSEDTFHYDPGTEFDYLAAGETATDTFSYAITDAAGESSTSTVSITLTGQNDGPVAIAIAKQTDETTAIEIAPEFSDSDSTDNHTYSVDTSGTLGAVTINEDGTFSYDPNGKFDNLDVGETATDTFTYMVTDAAGESSTETVTITVHGKGQGQNTPPITYPVELTSHEDGRIVFRIIFQDPDLGDTHTYSVNTNELDGMLSKTGDGVFEYTPNPVFDYLSNGETGTDTFTYTVTDNHGGSHTSTVTLTIIGENDAPVASAVNVSTTESNSVVVSPVFVDPDTNDTHSFTVDTSSTSGTVTINDDGTFTYDPNGQFNNLNNGEVATDTFSYTVTDSLGGSSTETVTVTVNGESDFAVSPAKLLASDGAAEDNFGRHAQVNDQGVIVVGSHGDDDNGRNSGSVYVYRPNEDGTFVETKLMASDGGRTGAFGENVAINNSGVIAVGAAVPGSNVHGSGLVYVYTPDEDGGYTESKISISQKGILGVHGLHINDNGVIAAANYYGHTDVIYIFTPDGSGGYVEAKLTSPDGFGAEMSFNDDGVVFTGWPNDLARVFTPDGSGGYTEMQLTPPETDNLFGYRGVVRDDGAIVTTGLRAVWIYEPNGQGNYTVTKLNSDRNSTQVATNSSGVIASNYSEDAAVVYVPDGFGNYLQIILRANDSGAGDPFDAFGNDISINEDGVVTVSASHDDDKGQDSGSVYVFVPNEDGNYVGPDGTVYEPSDTAPVIEIFDSTPLTINGSENAEVLKGGVDADTINGHDGDDVISGGSGDDQLSGGAGNDTFKFATGESGHDVITDFEAGAGSFDVIEFESSVFADFDAVMASVEDSGSNVVITIDEDTSITLRGVNVTDLHQDDFTFV
ncbi:VCBS repeat-containing protein [Pseudovibrio ascidiaceicola]|uniref:VCBS repeat-containing protein n=1 Tax=Pseudovibrio ascidiaceicola TaxID=285279 RepID=A0A1I4CZB1_9HYPH|nr:VCBS domain-containing protein [Pseudovibrio ascidiaceicola]SFK86668.1 VCBS repeat-containing protein [Pseudovibrio ascidiaceicola]